jgi:hypothetical protein
MVMVVMTMNCYIKEMRLLDACMFILDVSHWWEHTHICVCMHADVCVCVVQHIKHGMFSELVHLPLS